MSTTLNNQSGQSSKIDLLLEILQTTNTVEPIAVQAVSALIGIIKQGRTTGKTDEEIKAQAADSDATAQRVRDKSEAEMGDQP